MVGDQTYATACVGYNPRDSRAPIPTAFSFFERMGLISYTAATQTYRVFAPNNVQETFAPADRDGSAAPSTIAFVKPSTTAGAFERFSLIQPSPGGVATDYLRYSVSDFEGSTTSGTRARTKSYCVLGVPTLTTDIPVASTVSFTRFAVVGEVFDARAGAAISYSLAKSTATMTVDLTTGNFTSVLHLIGTPATGADVDFGTYNEQGSVNVDTAGFGGNSFAAPGAISVGVQGGFFGPQGRDFGYVFSTAQYSTGSPSDIVLTFTGAVVGSR